MKRILSKQAFGGLLLVLWLFGLSSGQRTPSENAMREILDIVNDPATYNKDIPPYNASGPVNVLTSMYIYSVGLDDAKMEMDVRAIFRMHWNDSRLVFSQKHSGVRRLTFNDASKFWTPDLFFGNSILTEKMNFLAKDPEILILIHGDGEITFSQRIQLKIPCPMLLVYVPHDSQVCAIEIESYASNVEEMLIGFKESKTGKSVNFDPAYATVTTNRLFRITNLTTRSILASTSTATYQRLGIEIKFKREFSIYLTDWYIPVMCLVIIALVSEFLEISAIMPRIALSVGPLLTLQVLSFFYNKTLPTVAFAKAIDVYTGVSFIFIFVVFLHSILGYYFQMNPLNPDLGGDLGKKLKPICARCNLIIKLLIWASYFLFLIIYFSSYKQK